MKVNLHLKKKLYQTLIVLYLCPHYNSRSVILFHAVEHSEEKEENTNTSHYLVV